VALTYSASTTLTNNDDFHQIAQLPYRKSDVIHQLERVGLLPVDEAGDVVDKHRLFRCHMMPG